MSAAAPRAWLPADAVVLVPSCGSSGDGTAFPDLRIGDFGRGPGNWTVVSPNGAVRGSGIGHGPSVLPAAQADVPAESRAAAGPGLTISFDSLVGSGISETATAGNAAPAVRDPDAILTDPSVHLAIRGEPPLGIFPVDTVVPPFLFRAGSGQAPWRCDGLAYFQAAVPPTGFLECRDLDTGSGVDPVHFSTP